MFKKIIFTTFSFLAVPAVVFGQTQLSNPLSGANINSLPELFNRIIEILTVFIGLFAVLAIVLAGYQMVMGGGDAEKIKTAKDRMFWAIIGLVVVLLAYSLVKIILNLITNSQI